ncbi:phage portal protein [Streptomyces sp. ME02-6991-2B]|nr:phage portal protein [Streptomyces sp. ME02-6991-2B]
MALPDTGAAWPPPQWAPIYAAMRVDDAWYSGDRARLARVYGHHHDPHQRRPRGLWGRRTAHTPGRRDHRLHVPFAGDIAATSADLLFADMPAITVEDTTTGARLESLINEGRIQQSLLSGAEQAAALSGVYLRVTWDRDLVPDRPILTVMQPDQAVPEFAFGMLRAVNFWRDLSGSTPVQTWRHIERHEPGRIVHALYEGTADTIGHPVPLTEHPETVGLADVLDDANSITTGITQLTAAYVPNMLPNRLHRGSPVGRSDYAALHGLFDQLDEVWTSWMRDIRLARARLIVPDGYLRDHGPGAGATFDEDREVWQTLKMPPNADGAGITLSQFAIRVDEHRATAEAIIRQAAQTAGYSASSFGIYDGQAAQTATEVDSKDRRSDLTRKKKSGYWRHALADMLHVMQLIDVAQFGQRYTPERPTVAFGDGVAESEQSTATTLDLLNRAGAVSTATKVKIAHPEWDDAAVQAEVAAILAETGAAAPDPVGNFPLAS